MKGIAATLMATMLATAPALAGDHSLEERTATESETKLSITLHEETSYPLSLPGARAAMFALYGNPENLKRIAKFTMFGIALSETGLDESISDAYQEEWRNTDLDEISEKVTHLGDATYMLPAYLVAHEIGERTGREWLSAWADRSAIATMVGTPGMLLSQQIIGSGRPRDGEATGFRPFMHDNGASGHAFISAVPFITAAKMTQNKAAKSAWYAASAIGGLSRINDDAHYASQVFLGYSWAVISAKTAAGENPDETMLPRFRGFDIMPIIGDGEYGITVHKSF